MSQVHKETLTAVDNALPNRVGLDIEIFGMEGIPEDVVQQHNQRVLTNFHQAQAERQAATGNPPPGAGTPNAAKKPKTEAISDLKKRLAEHKAAKLAAEQTNDGSSGDNTPVGAGQGQTLVQGGFVSHLPTMIDGVTHPFQATNPAYTTGQQTYAAPPSNGTYTQAQPFSQVPGQSPYQSQPVSYPPGAINKPQSPYTQPPGQPQFPPQPPYAQPPQPFFQQQQQQQPPVSYTPPTSFSPPQFQNQAPYLAQPYGQNGPGAFPGQPGLPARPYGAVSPVPGFPTQHQSPPPNGSLPAPVRTGSVSLPSAPGLPQRPAFGAPPVNAFQFQQMHQGQIPAPQNHTIPPQFPRPDPPPGGFGNQPQSVSPPIEAPNAASIDDLISSASKQADATAAVIPKPSTAPAETTSTPQPVPADPKEEAAAEDKGSKKDKEKPKTTRLVYSDNETSPEEKMALMAKYTFTPAQRPIVA